LSPAYDAASDFHEGFVDKREPFEADAQSAEVVKPRNGPLHDPACFTQSAAVRLAAPSNFRGNARCVQRTSMFVVVVASVALNDPRLRYWSARLAADGRNSLDQCLKLSDVVAVGAGQYHRERNALRFGDEVVL